MKVKHLKRNNLIRKINLIRMNQNLVKIARNLVWMKTKGKRQKKRMAIALTSERLIVTKRRKLPIAQIKKMTNQTSKKLAIMMSHQTKNKRC